MKFRLTQGLVLGVVAVSALLLFWFQPWLLITDSEVSEALPSASSSPTALPAETEIASEAKATIAPLTSFVGSFVSHEHVTTGTVRILTLADDSRVLRLENFNTSNGPDLEVWLSDAPVIEGQAGWYLADDGEHVGLGKLKGNKGNQNYEIPPEVDLARFRSVAIWCVRFSVSFGAAELAK